MAMSGSMDIQLQGSKSIAHITIREHGNVLFRAATRDHLNAQRLCITGLPLTDAAL